MTIINIAGYQFISLTDLTALRTKLLKQCQLLNLQGTILLSSEGININLAGLANDIDLFKSFLKTDNRFAEIKFHVGHSDFMPFKHTRVKIKKEIITMRLPTVRPDIKRAPSITPQEFKQWLDEERDITVLDTRNDYEFRFGTFKNAINPQIDNFSAFSETAKKLDPNKPVVMFCTGGIRCEKAALHLINEGFSQVFQLQNGILNYFKEIGNAHYDGECFVFDQRISVDANLAVTGTTQCTLCQGPIKNTSQHQCNA